MHITEFKSELAHSVIRGLNIHWSSLSDWAEMAQITTPGSEGEYTEQSLKLVVLTHTCQILLNIFITDLS